MDIKRMFMHWLMLIIAGLCEVGFATCLVKAGESTGTRWTLWMLAFVAFLSVSMLLMYQATKVIPMGTAYAVWTGIGAAGMVLVGILFFKEPATFWRLFFLFTLITSIVGLKFVAN